MHLPPCISSTGAQHPLVGRGWCIILQAEKNRNDTKQENRSVGTQEKKRKKTKDRTQEKARTDAGVWDMKVRYSTMRIARRCRRKARGDGHGYGEQLPSAAREDTKRVPGPLGSDACRSGTALPSLPELEPVLVQQPGGHRAQTKTGTSACSSAAAPRVQCVHCSLLSLAMECLPALPHHPTRGPTDPAPP